MTCRERLTKDWPQNVFPNTPGGCMGCPSTYRYLPDPDFCQDTSKTTNEKCTACWDREMDEPTIENKETETHMTINEYQTMALKTEARKDIHDTAYTMLHYAMRELHIAHEPEESMAMWRLLNGALGLNGEAGEVADIIKKGFFQGHSIDREHIAKELGDVAWYLALVADAIGYSLEDIFQMNIDKLAARYPDGFFKVEESVNRKIGDI